MEWPPDVVCDGTTDDTSALQRAFDRGGRVALPAGARLTVSVPLALDLAGATLKVTAGAAPGPFFRILADDVAIRDGARGSVRGRDLRDRCGSCRRSAGLWRSRTAFTP